ncbi:hypothetical protein ST47_g7179 [Ascochyta rabiei]|uniref:Uncharacterized protein n=1 Tax=Didymella rabiei TaxID=5454 RepID=A0A163BAR0_DIDRA|nr:hypothetical protein ST47_g7179 [Ascochyta rabiei]
MHGVVQELDASQKGVCVRESLLPEEQTIKAQRSRSESASGTEFNKQAPLSQTWLWWKLEILSWCGSFCCFVAIVVVMRSFEGQPLPHLQFGIAPNAVIGVLATLTELLLVVPVRTGIGQVKWLQAVRKRPMDDFRSIDEASRGPWGSILLLTQRKGGLTGSFSAVVIILALGMATFTQQALSYHVVFPQSNDAQMPVANIMNGTGWAQLADGTNVYGIDPQMLSAPYVGLFSRPDTAFTAKTHCATSNCTWEPYETLGVCNTCVDLTSKLRKIKATAEMILVGQDREEKKAYYTTNHYALPNNFTLMGKQSGEIYSASVLQSNGLLNLSTTLSGPKGGSNIYAEKPGQTWASVAFANNGSKLFSVLGVGPLNGSFIEQPDSNFTTKDTGNVNAPPVAFQCLLQYCVRTMRAAATNGSIYETEVSRWTDQTQSFYNASGYFTDIVLHPPGSPTAFRVNGYAGGTLSKWLSTYLEGDVTGWRNLSTLPAGLVGYDSQVQEIIAPSSLFVQPIYQAMNESNTGFPDLMQNLAEAMSLGLRNLPYQPAPVRGRAFTTTTRAVVTWPWLILPALELVGSLAFLIAIMVETRRRNMVPWTNNVLAYFFHGLRQPVVEERLLSPAQMEEKAKGLLIKFWKDKDGGQLVVEKQ